MPGSGFRFDDVGIGKLLQQGRLHVPPNQRSYAWREKHVRYLLQDLNEAITKGDGASYFLGTIVLIQKSSETPAIEDGQQRLATTIILLARIRDELLRLKREDSARSIEHGFLMNIDRRSEKHVPKISLNLEDNEYFVSHILPAMPTHIERPARRSNRLLVGASTIISEVVSDLLKHLPTDARFDFLQRWVDFLEYSATVLVITVPDEVSAFRMFETLMTVGSKPRRPTF